MTTTQACQILYGYVPANLPRVEPQKCHLTLRIGPTARDLWRTHRQCNQILKALQKPNSARGRGWLVVDGQLVLRFGAEPSITTMNNITLRKTI